LCFFFVFESKERGKRKGDLSFQGHKDRIKIERKKGKKGS